MNRDLYLNEGLSLGENTVYEFLLNGPMSLKNLSDSNIKWRSNRGQNQQH